MINNGRRLPYLHWLEDECFFSLCSRQHFFWGNHSPHETLKYLFGNLIKSFSHDFPRSLILLNGDAKSAWGSSEEIICKHTISPIFFPFRSPDQVHALKQAMDSRSLGVFKYKLGLITGRLGAEHPLKACTQCMILDNSIHGMEYWHLSHQLPGVITCPVHGCLLMVSTEIRQLSRKFRWILPDETALEYGYSSPSLSTLQKLQTMSLSAVALARLGLTCHFEPNIVAQVYKRAINIPENNWRAHQAVADHFAGYCSELQPYPPFSALPCSVECAKSFIAQMTRTPRS